MRAGGRAGDCINARRARATAFLAGREGGLSEPRARLVKAGGSPQFSVIFVFFCKVSSLITGERKGLEP